MNNIQKEKREKALSQAWGFVLLCSLLLLLASCTEEIIDGPGKKPYSGNGVAVKFAIGNLAYNGNEVHTRTSPPDPLTSPPAPLHKRGEEDRFAGDGGETETVVVPVGNNLTMVATLEVEHDVNLRIATAGGNFAADAKLRIVAYENGTDYHNHADFTVTNNVLVGTPLEVDPGKYRFVAYSYNSAAALPLLTGLPGHNEYTIPALDPANDLLLGAYPSFTQECTVNESSFEEFTINMSHALSLLTIVAKTEMLPDYYDITAMNDVTVAGAKVKLTLPDGTLEPAGGNFDQDISGWGGMGTQTVTSEPRTVYTGGSQTVTLQIGSLTLSDAQHNSLPITGLEATFNKKLEPGIAYTLKAYFKKDEDGTISLSPYNILLSHTAHAPASQTISVQSLKSSGAHDPTKPWTLTSDQSWLTLSLNPDGSGASSTVSGAGSQTVYLVAGANSSTTVPRMALVTLDSTGEVTQIVQTVDLGAITGIGQSATNSLWVGAFWRASETGERILKITPFLTGTWTVSVAWVDSKWNIAAGDGIILATGKSSDPGVTWAAGENPGDAEDWQIAGNAMSVSGTAIALQDFIFRIGLQKKFTAYNKDTNPARYAIVVLSFDDGTNKRIQKFFLRQGEGADYLMSPNDPISVSGFNSPARPAAVKFMPYNLTDPAGASPTSVTASSTAGLPLNGGDFVKFPTQGGHLFRWNYNRQAFSAALPSTSAINGWTTSQYSSLWNAAFTETCPEGYRRPNDGAASQTNGAAANSEIRQSLWWKPPVGLSPDPPYPPPSNTENSVYGFYADGFFDRRQIVSGVGVTYSPNFAVSRNNNNIAFRGTLFFNPLAASDHYNASVFLPFAGFRNDVDGVLNDGNSYVFGGGSYWTTSSYASHLAWNLFVDGGKASMIHLSSAKGLGLSVRCVKIE